ncbi:MAG TPA: hypothetical protein VFQ40_02525 [Actinomycetota bacterium]|nr:hypothetical protein [Actinomycetota bacterium]
MAAKDDPVADEDRDTVAPEPERREPADAGGDSPGPGMGVPDEPMASDRPGTTAEEQRRPSFERRLGMERPDVFETRSGDAGEPVGAILDDDVATEELNVEEPMFEASEADLDRTRQEAAEVSPDAEDEDDGPEGAAMHIESD